MEVSDRAAGPYNEPAPAPQIDLNALAEVCFGLSPDAGPLQELLASPDFFSDGSRFRCSMAAFSACLGTVLSEVGTFEPNMCNLLLQCATKLMSQNEAAVSSVLDLVEVFCLNLEKCFKMSQSQLEIGVEQIAAQPPSSSLDLMAHLQFQAACLHYLNATHNAAAGQLDDTTADFLLAPGLVQCRFGIWNLIIERSKLVWQGLNQHSIADAAAAVRANKKLGTNSIATYLGPVVACCIPQMDMAARPFPLILVEHLLTSCRMGCEQQDFVLMNVAWKQLSMLVTAPVVQDSLQQNRTLVAQALSILMDQLQQRVENIESISHNLAKNLDQPKLKSGLGRQVKVCRFYLLNLNKISRASGAIFGQDCAERFVSLYLRLFSVTDMTEVQVECHSYITEQVAQQPGPIFDSIIVGFLQQTELSNTHQLRMLARLTCSSCQSEATSTANTLAATTAATTTATTTTTASTTASTAAAASEIDAQAAAKLNAVAMLFSQAADLPLHIQNWLAKDGVLALAHHLQACAAISLHPEGHSLLAICLSAVSNMHHLCQQQSLTEGGSSPLSALEAGLWRVLADAHHPLTRQFAVGCWCVVAQQSSPSYQLNLVHTLLQLSSNSPNALPTATATPATTTATAAAAAAAAESGVSDDEDSLSWGQSVFCDLLSQLYAVVSQQAQGGIIQALLQTREEPSRPDPKEAGIAIPMPVRVCLLSLLPVQSMTPAVHDQLWNLLLRPALCQLQTWIQSEHPRLSLSRAHSLDCIAAILQHKTLSKPSRDLRQICQLACDIMTCKRQTADGGSVMLVTCSPSLLQALLRLTSCDELADQLSPQQVHTLLSAAKVVLHLHPWCAPAVAELLGVTAQLKLGQLPIKEAVWQLTKDMFHHLLQSPPPPPPPPSPTPIPVAWTERDVQANLTFVAGLSTFYTYSSFNREFGDRLEELIPPASYDHVVRYINCLVEPPPMEVTLEWSALRHEQQCGARQSSARKRKINGFTLDESNRSRVRTTKRARAVLQSVQTNLQQLLATVSAGPLSADNQVLLQHSHQTWLKILKRAHDGQSPAVSG